MRLVVLIYLIIFISFSYASDPFAIFEKEFKITQKEVGIKIDVDVSKLVVRKGDKSDICSIYVKYNKDESDTDIYFNEDKSELNIYIDNLNIFQDEDNDYNYDGSCYIWCLNLDKSPWCRGDRDGD